MNTLGYSVAITIPCYNEEKRLNLQKFRDFSSMYTPLKLIFVNDSSTDNTGQILREFVAESPSSYTLLELETNVGKAEAVRRGILKSLSNHPKYVGYWDADLATPLREIKEFCNVLELNEELIGVFGSRVKMLGRNISRNASRHYSSRIFATFASLVLRLGVYDTQCGAKIFRATDEIVKIFGTPFLSKWIFDVEILARLIQNRVHGDNSNIENLIYEYPLSEWIDIGGSKIGIMDAAKAVIELWRINRTYLD